MSLCQEHTYICNDCGKIFCGKHINCIYKTLYTDYGEWSSDEIDTIILTNVVSKENDLVNVI